MAIPDRKTIAIAVLIVGGVALVLWLMMQNQNRADRAASADGEAPTGEPRVTVAVLHRLVADDRETAGRWLGGKTVRVNGAVSLVARVPDGNGGTALVVGLSSAAAQDSTTVLGLVADAKDVERLQIHEPAELRGTLELGAGPKGFVTLKDASLVRPWSRGRSLH